MFTQQPRRLALIAAVLFKFGSGPTFLWFINSLYYISYLHLRDSAVTFQSKNKYLAITCLIAGPAFVLSVNIKNWIGFHNVIKLSCALSVISLFLLYYSDGPALFVAGVLLLPMLCLVITIIPLLQYVWSLFGQTKNLITGVLAFTASVSSIIFMVFYFQMVNSENVGIDEKGYFPRQVCERVKGASLICSGLSSAFYLLGGLILLKSRSGEQEYEAHQQSQISDQQQFNLQKILKELPVFDAQFIRLYAVAVLTSSFLIYFNNNFKEFLLPLFSDRFVSYLYSAGLVLSTLASLLWGYLADRFGFGKVYFYLSVGFCVSSGLLSLFLFLNGSVSKLSFIFVLINSLVDRGVFVLQTAALIELFGESVGSRLISIKSTSFFLAMMLGITLQGLAGTSSRILLLLSVVALTIPVLVKPFY